VLTLTANAAQAIRDLTAAAPEPSQSGIRISSQGEGTGSLTLTLATAPEPADAVVDQIVGANDGVGAASGRE